VYNGKDNTFHRANGQIHYLWNQLIPVMRLFLLSLGFLILQFFCQAQERTLGYYLEKGAANSPYLQDLNNQLASNSIDSLLILA